MLIDNYNHQRNKIEMINKRHRDGKNTQFK